MTQNVALATPNDTYFDLQWHLNNTGQNGGTARIDLNVLPIWDLYKGNGIKIGVIDDGVDSEHDDLSANYNASLAWNTVDNNADASPSDLRGDAHGTAVSGVIVADDNGRGVVGVAPDASLSGLQIGFGSNGTIEQINEAFARSVNFDVVNNSWGFVSSFADDFDRGFLTIAATNMMNAVENGRGGLGTSIVFAAGNDRSEGDDVNYHNFQNSPYTIAVGALNNQGTFSSFSTPGAAILVSAPGVGIVTTDNTGASGYVGSDYLSISGTSFAAPAVSGVIALMLDANEDLGYRDIQEILAYSSRQVDAGHNDWQSNGAGNWNGGGLHLSHQYGYGLVDAAAAVRLSETWLKTGQDSATYANIDDVTAVNNTSVAIPDAGAGPAHSSLSIETNLLIDQVQVSIDITHSHIGHLDVVLVSPSGTLAILVNNSDASPYNSDDPGSSNNSIDFLLNSVSFWGEQSAGTWRLEITDRITGDTGTLNNWSLEVLGDVLTFDDVYVYTDEFSRVSRSVLVDKNGGTDTLNFAAVSTDVMIDLSKEKASTVAGQTLTFDAVTRIENVIGGVGNDVVHGNEIANNLRGRGGDDHLFGGGGDDVLSGDTGNDSLFGGAGNDTVTYGEQDRSSGVNANLALGVAVLNNGETDLLFSIENLTGSAENDTLNGTSQANTLKGGDGDDALYAGLGNDVLYGEFGDDVLYGGMDNDVLYGGDGDDALYGENGSDVLHGGDGDDTVLGGSGNDTLNGDDGDDFLRGGGDDDSVSGGNGDDNVNGDEGEDLLHGNGGDDRIFGGGGDDILYGDSGSDFLYGGMGDDTLYGGQGADELRGNAGRDTFVLGDLDGEFYDTILDFSYGGEADRIDLNALLSVFDSEVDQLSDYVRVTQVASNARIYVSAEGNGNFVVAADVFGDAYAISGHSVDELVASGHFIV